MARSTPGLTVTPGQEKQIEQWPAAMGTPQQVTLRCGIVSALAQGETESAVASKLDINRKTVRLWRQRFVAEGLNSLWEIAPGRGRKATYGRNASRLSSMRPYNRSQKATPTGVVG